MSRGRQKATSTTGVLLGLALSASGFPRPVQAAPPEATPTEEPAAGDTDSEAAPESPTEQAKILAQDGRRLFWQGEYEAAIEAFEAAHALAADPNLLFNIATAYEKLENYEQAIAYLDRYTPDAPAEEKDALTAKRNELQQALEAAREPRPAGPIPEGPTPDPAPTPEPRKPVMGALGWSMVGVAVAGLGVGVGFGSASLVRSREGRDSCTETGGDLVCPSSAEAVLVDARRNAIIADVGFGVAVLATAAALTIMGVRLKARRQAQDDNSKGGIVTLQGLGARVRF